MPGLADLAKDVRARFGLIAVALGVVNNLVFPVIPISPLLRGLATLFLLIFCFLAILWAHSFSKDLPVGPAGNSRLRKWGLWAFVLGLLLMVGYFASAEYFHLHDVQEEVLNRVVDVGQALLFALPWMFWSAAGVLLAPRS